MEQEHNEPEKPEEHVELWSFPPIADAASIQVSVAEEAHQTEATEAALETQRLQEALTHQLELITGIRKELAETLKHVNKELLLQLITCVKKVTHKIIATELAQNDQALANMVQQTLETLDTFDACTVFVAPEDYARLMQMECALDKQMVQEDASLSSGDYKITTPTGSINALLAERIEKLFGITS